MLLIRIGDHEVYDEETCTFSVGGNVIDLEFEHSLVSLSKWESKYNIPFLGDIEKTTEQVRYYLWCMITNEDVPVDIIDRLTREDISRIQSYIDETMSATTFNERQGIGKPGTRKEIVTSELIYYWMVGFRIPFECQYWHLNRLMALIRICNIKQENPKKRSGRDIAQEYRDLNAQRRASMNTTG